jgi:hypothetical protein
MNTQVMPAMELDLTSWQVGLSAVMHADKAMKAMVLCLDVPMDTRNKLLLLNSLIVMCGATHDGHK